jgi:hypothetical protein
MKRAWTIRENEEKALRPRISGVHLTIRVTLFLSAFLCVALRLPPALAQSQTAEQEVVANHAGGRVILTVARDAILIAAIENRFEPEARPPVIVQLSRQRIAILLGAVEWTSPIGATDPVRLDNEITRVMGGISGPKRLAQEQESDLENLGLAFLEPLRNAAARLHHRVNLPPDEPLLELLLVGYVEGYGPEVWSLRYRMAQDPLRGDYWQTRVLRPAYNQLYPPEKGQPRTLMETRYPPEEKRNEVDPTLLELLLSGDERLDRIRTGDPAATRATQRLHAGESNKATAAELTAFLQTALNAIVPPERALALAIIRERTGFEWVIAPPPPAPEKRAEDDKDREPGAPTLRKKPPE